MNGIFLLLVIAFCVKGHCEHLLDLEAFAQDFVLETKRIEVPGYPFAFNPSIARWRGQLLMSFRVVPDPKRKYESEIGVVFLNQDFEAMTPPQLLNLRDENTIAPNRAEDARLITIGDRIFIIYSDNPEVVLSRGGFRMHVAELIFDSEHFIVENTEKLLRFEGESKELREKNWVPFVYQGTLLMAYSLTPHQIFFPRLDGSETCDTLFSTHKAAPWDLGTLRGGTPAVLEDDHYLAFFHSSKRQASIHSKGKEILHYFMGAYAFSKEPPFHITAMSPSPIVGKNFYSGTDYPHYWFPVRCAFPCGILSDKDFVFITYGRDDHECWVAKLDKHKLLQSLEPIF